MSKAKRLTAIAAIFCLFIVFSAPLMASDKVNINTADQIELCTLKNIGEKYAERIIEYRKGHKFKTPEEIMEVKGIGTKIYETNNNRTHHLTCDFTFCTINGNSY